MYRLHLGIHAYGGTTVSARDTADSVISALTPAAWYRNATGVTSAGGFASQWDDYSGNTRHLVQATGTNQPAYSAGVFTFDGADNYIKTSAFTAVTSPYTLYAVLEQQTWTLNDILIGLNSADTVFFRQSATTPDCYMFAASSGAATSLITVGSRHIVCIVVNGASGSVRVNNNAKSASSAGTNSMNQICLGSINGATFPANVSFEEVVAFSGAHSDANQSDVITALNNALTVF